MNDGLGIAVMLLMSAYPLWLIAKGFKTGEVEGVTKFSTWKARRADQRFGFWSIVIYNALLTAMLIGAAAFIAIRDAKF